MSGGSDKKTRQNTPSYEVHLGVCIYALPIVKSTCFSSSEVRNLWRHFWQNLR